MRHIRHKCESVKNPQIIDLLHSWMEPTTISFHPTTFLNTLRILRRFDIPFKAISA